MYCSHFGLHRPPFNNTPDPAFYYGTPEHEEALATLQYATTERKGFVLITGDVGAGKTLVGRMFLRRVEPQARTAVITHTHLNGRQLLAAICAEFELPAPPDANNLQLSDRLHAYLLEQFALDRHVVVLLDEAQNLPDESFEAVRMLGNLESDDAKLLQICILGQPELRRRFEQPALRQLDQRLFRRFHLRALNEAQTAEYIRHRLAVAGGAGRELFTPDALARVFAISGGTPRIVNKVCDNALLTAYGRGLAEVDIAIIEEVTGREEPSAAGPPPATDAPAVNQTVADADPGPAPAPAAPAAPGPDPRVVIEEMSALRRRMDDLSRRQERLRATACKAAAGSRSARQTWTQQHAQWQTTLDAALARCETVAQRADEVARAAAPAGELDAIRTSIRQEAGRALDEVARHRAEFLDLVRQTEARRQEAETLRASRDGERDQLIGGLSTHVARQDDDIRALTARVTGQFGELRTHLEALEKQTATTRDLEGIRMACTAAVSDALHRCEAQSENIARLKQEFDHAVACGDEALAARISDLSAALEGQVLELQQLGKAVALNQAGLQSRIEALATQVEAHREPLERLEEHLDLRRQEIATLSRQLTERLGTLSAELATTREQAATREDLEQLRAAQQQSQTQAIGGLTARLTRQGDAIHGLTARVSELFRELQATVDGLEKKALSTGDLDQVRMDCATAVSDALRRVEHLSDGLAELKQDIDHTLTPGQQAQGGRIDELNGLLQAHVRELRGLGHSVTAGQAGLQRRIDELAGEMEAQREPLGRLETRLDERGQEIAALSAQVEARLDGLAAELARTRAQSATREELGDLRTTQEQTHAQAFNGLTLRLSQQEDAIRTLGGKVSGLFADLRGALDGLEQRTLTPGDVEQVRVECAAAVSDALKRVDLLSDLLARSKGEIEQALAGSETSQAGRITQLADSLQLQIRGLRELSQRVVDQQAGLQQRIDALAGQIDAQGGPLRRMELDLDERRRQIETLSAEVDERLCKLADELAATREQSATRQEMENARFEQTRALAELRSRQEEIARGLSGELGRHADTIEGLGQRFAERSDIDVLRRQHESQTTHMLNRIELHRNALEGLIEGVVQRCRKTQEALDALAGCKADARDLAALGERQELTSAHLLSRLEEYKQAVHGQFEDVLTRWRETEAELAQIASTSAPASELEAVRRRQAEDTERFLRALADQHEELQRLLCEVNSRCDAIVVRIRKLPANVADSAELQAMRAEHAEQIRTVFAGLDARMLAFDQTLRDVAARCDRTEALIQELAARSASAEEVDRLRRRHDHDFGHIVDRLEREETEHQQELQELYAGWQAVTDHLLALAAVTSPASSVTELEQNLTQNLSELRGRLDSFAHRQQAESRDLVRELQQLTGRIMTLESMERPAPVRIELQPEAGRELAEITELARREIETARRELTALRETEAQVHASRVAVEATSRHMADAMRQWSENAGSVESRSRELHQSASSAATLLRTLQRAYRELDAKLNSEKWQQELSRGEALAGRLEAAARKGQTVTEQLLAALRDFNRCQKEAEAWTSRYQEATRLTDRLAHLLVRGRQAEDRLETELDSRKRVLTALARNTAGLVEVIEAARHAPEPESSPPPRRSPAPEGTRITRVEWPTLERVRVGAGKPN